MTGRIQLCFLQLRKEARENMNMYNPLQYSYTQFLILRVEEKPH